MLGLDNAHQHLGMSEMLPMSGLTAHLGMPSGGAGGGQAYHQASYNPYSGREHGQTDYGAPGGLHENQGYHQNHQLHQQHQHQHQLPQSESITNHNICMEDTNELPPPPPITPPPPKERFSYTRYQLEVLNGIYESVKYPNSIQKQLIAKRVGITRDQVKIWFQNRRRKDVVGVKSKSKTCQAEDTNGATMVPGHILKGVVSELIRYAEDPRLQNKKNKTKSASSSTESNRAKPYDRPSNGSHEKQLKSLQGSNSNHASYVTQRQNTEVNVQNQMANAPGFLGESNMKPSIEHQPSRSSPGRDCSLDPQGGAPYPPPICSVAMSMCSPGDRNEGQSVSEGGSPVSVGTPSTSLGNNSHLDVISSPLSQASSCGGSVHSSSSAHEQNRSDLHEKSSSSYPTFSTINSNRVQTSALIPSSEQLDMVAPPNAVAPGAPSGEESRDCYSPVSSDEETLPTETSQTKQEKSHSDSERLSSQEKIDPPPNVTAPKSDPLPDLSRLSSSSSQNSSPPSFSASSLGPPAPSHSIYAPIPSYARPQQSWMDHQMSGHPALDAFLANASHHSHNKAPPAISMTDYNMFCQPQPCPPHMKLPGHSGYGQQASPTGYTTQNGHFMAPPSLSHMGPDMMYKHPSHNSHSDPSQHSPIGLDRVLPFPLVADAPQMLSSMAPPPPFVNVCDPYNLAYKPPPHHHPSNFYRDTYQPLLISSLNNPYYNKESANWQNMDRKPYQNL